MQAIAPASLPAYPTGDEFFDEAFEAEDVPRPHYERLIGVPGPPHPHPLALGGAGGPPSAGSPFHPRLGGKPFRMDPVPRLFAADEWDELAAGLAQRVRA